MQLGTGLPQDLFEPLLRPCLIRCQPVVQGQRVALVFQLDAEQLQLGLEGSKPGASAFERRVPRYSSLLASVSAPWLPTM